MSGSLSLFDIMNNARLPYNSNQQNKFFSAIEIRNNAWEYKDEIPKWVDIDNLGLDQFFTRPDIAKKCWDSLCKYMITDGADISHYNFVEPSAGLGAFYDLLPDNQRIGIDVDKFRTEYIQQDFLSWLPKINGYRYACVGNPPFGYRAWLALIFLNHAALFSDYVGFILPMGFQSRGKSNLIDRVKGLYLVHSSSLPSDSFVDAEGKTIKINALWQIWARKKNCKKQNIPTCNQYIDLFTVDMRKERLCGQKRLHEADFFLQRTFYNTPPTLVKSFNEVKYVCGYGIVIKRAKAKIIQTLLDTDWRKYSNLAVHNCKHISMCHIREALTDAGFVDV
jgi:hypothetical protein